MNILGNINSEDDSTVQVLYLFGKCCRLQISFFRSFCSLFTETHETTDIETSRNKTLRQRERVRCYKTGNSHLLACFFNSCFVLLLSKTFIFKNVHTHYTLVRISSYQSSKIMFYNKTKSLPQLLTVQHSFVPKDKNSTDECWDTQFLNQLRPNTFLQHKKL